MPFVVRSDSENEAELEFLSPEEEAPHRKEPQQDQQDQGASPVLRRSNRKRKSVSTFGDSDMTKGSSSKKKKGSSPEPDKTMPKVPRTPQGQGQGQATDTSEASERRDSPSRAFEAMLLAMEARLGAKMEKAAAAAEEAVRVSKTTAENLSKLEARVSSNEVNLEGALAGVEERIMERMDKKVQEMVEGQLRSAGFDPELSAGDLTVRDSVKDQTSTTTYAVAASKNRSQVTEMRILKTTDKQTERFWHARRSLRLWPLGRGTKGDLEEYLLTKLRMDREFVEEELGEVVMVRAREPKNKNKEEFIVTFETKQVRDAVKAKAANLANYREEAGMRLHVPDHMQKDFHSLMNLSYDLKKKHPGLKRNVKFDEHDNGFYMDVKMSEKAEWKRIKPDRAAAVTRNRDGGRTKDLEADELRSLLEGEDNE